MTRDRGAPIGDGIRVTRDEADPDEAWRPIDVPGSWINTEVGGYYGYGWYRAKLNIPREHADQTLHLLFQGVDEQA